MQHCCHRPKCHYRPPPKSSQNRDDQSLFWAPWMFRPSTNSCNSTKAQHCIHVTFDIDIMHKLTSFHRLFINQSFARSQAIHTSIVLWFYIVRRATATVTAKATKQRQRHHHMLVSSPSCACAQASFYNVCCCSTTTTHDCVSNKSLCASARALYFGNAGKEYWWRSPHAQAHELSIRHCSQAHKL